MSRDDPDTPRPCDCLRATLYACLCVSTVACSPPPTSGVPPDASLFAPTEARILSESYPEWRARLRNQAARWQAQEPRTEFGTLPLQITEAQTGPTESLGVDYLYLPPLDSPSNLIVMISGIHGVEAPAGVLFQNVVLDHCAGSAIDRTRTGLLVVHVMNPFGAKHGRRFNSNNVDLNRNFFDADFNDGEAFQGRRERNEEYQSVKALLEDRRIGFFDVSFQYVGDFLRGRPENLQRALRGQYQRPRGIYFGGREVEPEARAVQALITRHLSSYKNIAVIDVHTGLGTSGINQIMANPLPTDPSGDLLRAYRRENSLLKRMFPESDCEGLCEVVYVDDNAQRTGPSSFVTTGDLTQWIHDKYPDKRLAGTVISVTSEIGTAKGADVLQALVNENFCYWNRNDPQCGDLQYQKDVHALRETFTPTDPQWQMQAVRAAHQICSALGIFAMEP